jgi:2,3,4,5-tetrahydropyridine-2-carboxylate N-succinyltransferase
MDNKPRVVKAASLSGVDNILFRRNSVSGAIEAVPWKGDGIALNAALHAN